MPISLIWWQAARRSRSRPKSGIISRLHVAIKKALQTIGDQDGWIEKLGPVGEALNTWKANIIDDLGGEANISAMEVVGRTRHANALVVVERGSLPAGAEVPHQQVAAGPVSDCVAAPERWRMRRER